MSKRAGNSGRTATGRPFPKGVSGNPSGRPKVPDEVRAEIAEVFAAASPRAARRLSKLIDSEDETVAMKASDIVLKRMLGDEVVLNLRGSVEVTEVSNARDKLLASVAAAAARLEASGGDSKPDGS